MPLVTTSKVLTNIIPRRPEPRDALRRTPRARAARRNSASCGAAVASRSTSLRRGAWRRLPTTPGRPREPPRCDALPLPTTSGARAERAAACANSRRASIAARAPRPAWAVLRSSLLLPRTGNGSGALCLDVLLKRALQRLERPVCRTVARKPHRAASQLQLRRRAAVSPPTPRSARGSASLSRARLTVHTHLLLLLPRAVLLNFRLSSLNNRHVLALRAASITTLITERLDRPAALLGDFFSSQRQA